MTFAAKAESLVPFERVEIIANGEVIESVTPEVPPRPWNYWSAELQQAFTRSDHHGSLLGALGRQGFAHTSPIVVRKNDLSFSQRTEAATTLRKLVEQTREWGECHASYTNTKRREQLLARCDEASGKLGAKTDGVRHNRSPTQSNRDLASDWHNSK